VDPQPRPYGVPMDVEEFRDGFVFIATFTHRLGGHDSHFSEVGFAVIIVDDRSITAIVLCNHV
jgi:hypothetical protein